MADSKEIKRNLIKVGRKAVSNPLFIAILVYSISIIVIGCWGNFPLNDDFYYLTQVKAFSNGIFTKSGLIGPTFILQGLIGLLWSKIFGLSYISLRVLTIIVTVFCIVGIDKVFSILNIQKKLRVFTLILIIFNPEFFSCSLTFMTENYFLLFTIWSLYYFLSYTKSKSEKSLLIACLLGGLSIMIRQYGVVLFVAYLLVSIILETKKITIRKLLIILIPFIVIGCAGIFWPKFKSIGDLKSQNMWLFFADAASFVSRITSISILPYIGFLLLPFTAFLFLRQRNCIKFLDLVIAIPVSYYFFGMNIFKFGNLFYLEGLYARLLINTRENFFNNTPFKLLVSYLISVSILSVTFYLLTKLITAVKRLKKTRMSDIIRGIDHRELTLVLLVLGFYVIATITDRVFDRYFINFFIVLLIYVAFKANKSNFSVGKLPILMGVFVCLITFFMSFHYFREMQLKWKMADELVSAGVGKYKIFIDNVYARAVYMELTDNYDGRLAAKPVNYRPICFVQEYTKHDINLLNSAILYIENRAFVRRHFPNPIIEDAGLMRERSNHYDPTDILMIDEEYPSPVYNLLGKRTFVRAFCTEPIQKVKGI